MSRSQKADKRPQEFKVSQDRLTFAALRSSDRKVGSLHFCCEFAFLIIIRSLIRSNFVLRTSIKFRAALKNQVFWNNFERDDDISGFWTQGHPRPRTMETYCVGRIRAKIVKSLWRPRIRIAFIFIHFGRHLNFIYVNLELN